MPSPVCWETDGDIGALVLNAPPSNAMTGVFFSELNNLVREVIPSSGVCGIVMYGAGRHFSSGADVEELTGRIHSEAIRTPGRGIDHFPPYMHENLDAFHFFAGLDIPVVAAIRGVCLGSALELALSCNIRLCGDGAVLGLPESTFNLMPGCGGCTRLAELCGTGRALELSLTGASFPADEALAMGIVDAVLPRGSVIEAAFERVRKIVRNRRGG
jgi:enoyl-CoA hydratase